MSTLSQAVQEAIKNDLPGLAATELKEFIARAEKDAIRVQQLNDVVNSRDRQILELNRELEAPGRLDQRRADIEASEKAVREQELTLLKRGAVLNAHVAQAELQGVKETVNLFLRNTIFREQVVSDVAKPVEGLAPNGPNTYGSPGHLQRDPRPDVVTTTRETE